MKRRLFLAMGIVALLMAALLPSGAVAQSPERFGRFDISGRTIDLGKLPSQKDPNRIVDVAVEVQGRAVAADIAAAADAGKPFSDAQRADARRLLGLRQARVATQLRTLGASIEATFTDVFNGFRIRVAAKQLGRLARLSGVTHLYTVPMHTIDTRNTDRYLGADKTWGQTGFTGMGVKIAIIDTGINYDHRDFAGAGAAAWAANDPTVIEPGTFPTAKVIGGYDLVGDDYDPGNPDNPGHDTPHPDPDPLDCKDPNAGDVQHGTHVAGIAAGTGVRAVGTTYSGPYDASTLDTVNFRIAPGVAPQASLMAYRVFGCDGSTSVLVDAIERAVRDGADVINMSIGSPLGNPGSLDAVASNNAALAGTTVVTSAGNEGPSAYAVGSPGVATRVIAVAAMDAESSFPGVIIDMATGSNILALNANDSGALPVTGPINRFHDDPNTPTDGDTGAGGENLGCDAASFAYNGFVAGEIAVVDRGACPRVQKVQVGQTQGADAVVMVNSSDGLPPYENFVRGVSIPFIGVSGSDGARFETDDGANITISSAGDIANPDYQHTADFTSAGPRRIDAMIKPDIAAPGVGVFSADGGTTAQGKNLSGTSMASPAVAGVAALVAQAHPSWSPRDIKAAIMGTANPQRVVPYDLRLSGPGVAQPRRAVDTRAFVYTDPGSSSLTFGYHQLGKEPGTSIAYQQTRTMTIRNTGGTAIHYDLTNAFNTPSLGLGVDISPTSVTVPAFSRRTVDVTLTMSEADAALLPDVAPGHGPDIGIDSFGQLYAPIIDVAGNIVAKPTTTGAGIYSLRVPWLVAPRGTSVIEDKPESRTPYQVSGNLRKSKITVQNYGLHEGIADVYAWGLQDAADGIDGIDLRAAGVQTLPSSICDSAAKPADRCIVFAVNTWGRWSNAAENEFDVNIDVDKDGTDDYSVVGVDASLILGAFTGVELSVVINDHTKTVVTVYLATAPTDGSTLLLPVLASDLGVSNGGTQDFEYYAASFDVYDDDGTLFQFDLMTTGNTPGLGDQLATYNVFRPSIHNSQFVPLNPGQTAKLNLVVDEPRYLPRHGQKGWLMVSLEDANGETQADMIPVGHLP